MIKSFLNYTGGKYRIIKQLLPLFPTYCDTMIDMFGGSGVVTANYKGADRYIFNDNNEQLIELMRYIENYSAESIEKII
ncbi:DNA adenine methylase [Lactobacillus johnsonii]|uniref:site-specific DNA-methyltransferase (adenine-specific) n=1 Tax=Lactobacillus johnsonii TaxID=33959 RepID=A0A9X6P6W8_LACJH|nr:DNA adenine methylase [Lactobacillus johnsonii]OYS04191.1 hypothetical protein CBF54_04580 [Lactobacillus johnsonii]OYS04753.1 hypothetical protein CBF62_09495 [Lactobacillus johnsonii]OYS09038.1 hypothetical protein CBF65_04550 [Lactobacillus johnsonii]OYS10191.1 hypothetical protein CBF63_03405 [Lactobacillus johnsonii]